MLEVDEQARADLRERYRAFTVDEYQDVNLLQQTLLELWVGPRDDLCVVGDDYQAIYSFTGASPAWLLGMQERFPHATVARLEENYRSTPEVLALANRLVPKLGGAEKVLRATRPAGPAPEVRAFASAEAEGAWLVAELKRLAAEGVPLEETAILCRTNARLADFEELLHDAGLPFQGSSLLEREAARRLLRALRGSEAADVAERVRRLAEEAGWLPVLPERLGERELVRQTDLARLVRLAETFDDGTRTGAEFVAELERRFDPGGDAARGVNLMTYHRAKGLEFEAVFLPRVEDKELPSRLAKTDEERAEERRLLYVGMTRAKRVLAVTWSRRPSPFVAELGVASAARPAPSQKTAWTPEGEALRRWRAERARAEGVPAYTVFPDRTIEELLARRPRTEAELAGVHGLGPSRIARFGPELLAALAGVLDGDVPAPVAAPPSPAPRAGDADGLYEALSAWRRDRAREDAIPPYHVFHNAVLDEIAARRPRSREELAAVPGVGPAKLDRYGDAVLEVVAAA
jgi:DNA helicase-2/ATP-dependent DNA helicase PcrA